ncbi:MAG: molybdopterin-dependent oxidoreductase [Pseudonocardia sp.]|nr:molybdopterin-dependent oxidoreductase [Pseudonocardia sp.]
MAARHSSVEQGTTTPGGIGRRRFLGYLIAAPTLAVAVPIGASVLGPAAARALPTPVPEPAEIFDLSDLILTSTQPTANLITVVVNEDGTVSFSMPRAESGQGITTMAAMLIAEEMDVRVEDVTVTLADARPELIFNQQTQASSTAITMYEPIRVAAALARGRLLEAAAIKLGEEVRNLRTDAGKVITKSGSNIPFADLAVDAANVATRQVLAELRPQDQFKIIGTEVRRDDVVAAVTGRKTYTTDIDFPEALPTMVARPPMIQGTVESVNNLDEVRNMPGITDVVTISTDAAPDFSHSGQSGVAVRGRTFGQCIAAVRALDITWSGGTVDGASDESVLQQLRAAQAPFSVPSPSPLDEAAGQIPLVTEGLGELGLIEAIEEEFVFYWRSNSAMEPNVAVADVRDDSAEVWTPTQVPIWTQQQVAEELGLPLSQVTVHVMRGGGAFGRRLFNDAPLEAVRISKQTGKPVRLMWHRTDECRAGRVHPMCTSRIRATYSKSAGQVVSFEQRHTSVATDYTEVFGEMLLANVARLPFTNELAVAQSVFLLTAAVPYDFGAVVLGLNEIGAFDTFNTGSVRNLYNMDVRPAQELMVDRLAAKLGKDRLDFRLETLESGRARKVLETVRDQGGWGRSLPDGVAQGVAVHEEYKGAMAVIAEVDTRPATVNRQIPGATTGPRVTKVTLAVDVGLPINPLGLRAQMQGGIMTGIAHVFTASLHLRDGNFLEGSWDDYRYTRHWNAPPEINVIVLPPNGERIGGAGEFPVAASTAAVACAYAAASGTMPTSFPIGHNEGIPFDVKTFQPPIPASPTNGLEFYPAPKAATGTFNPAQ